jgi:streptogramin lyase/putative copper export protein/methionine-rich copper-binding protein CopC
VSLLSGARRKLSENARRINGNYIGLTLAILVLLLTGFITPVYAHANLVRSDPPPNSVLQTSPRQVTLAFSEQLAPRFSQASVYDSNGKRVDNGYSIDTKDPTIMTISLPELPSGIYTVVWKAVSAIDGHFTNGSFPFGIGNVTINVAPNQGAGAPFTFPSPIEVVDRWLNFLSEAVFFGGATFVLLVWMPTRSNESLKMDEETDRKFISGTKRLLEISASIALVATVVSLIIQTLTVVGPIPLDQFPVYAGTIISSTTFGMDWVVRVATICAAIIVMKLLVTGTSRESWIGALAIGGFLLLTTSLTSHNAASNSNLPLVNLASDWLHLTAVSLWVGGLVSFAFALTRLNGLKENRPLLAELIRSFSSLAVVSVGVIGLTGLYSLLLEVGTFSALFSTGYGILLLAKISLFAPMIALGALNQFKVYNGLTVGTTGSATNSGPLIRRFNFSIRTEVALGMIILMVVGVLTASAPVAQTATAPPSYNPQPIVLKGSSEEGVNVTLKIFPLQVGSNHFELDFSDSQGNPVNDVTGASVKFKFLDQNVGEATATAAKTNTAQYSFDGTYLSFPGNWQLGVSAQRSHGYDVITSFKVDVPSLAVRFSELPLSSQSEPYGITVDNHNTVWFTETGTGQIASYNPATGTLKQFALPRTGSRPFYLTADQYGAIWISDTQYNLIVRFDTNSETFNEFNIPTVGSVPGGIVTDGNGNVWFTEEIGGKIGRLIPSTGVISEFPIPTENSIPIQLAVDHHGNIWFTESKSGKIGSLNPLNGTITEFAPFNSTLLGPTGVVIGPDGAVWLTEHGGNRITRFDTTNQTFKNFPLSNNQAFPFGLAFYQQNRIWFVEHIGNAIATLDLTTGRVDTFSIPKPSSDVQLLAVDSKGNVWFTLPAVNVLGVLTSTTSGLQLETSSSSQTLTQIVIISSATIIVTVPVVLLLGQRRMRRKRVSSVPALMSGLTRSS